MIKITLECIVNLVFTEGLPHYMVLRYLVSFPGSIGGPVIGLTIAITSLLIGIAVWLSMEYSLASGVGFAAGSGYFMSHLTCLIKAKRNFSSVRGSEGARSWEWIKKDQLHEYTHHTSLFGTSTWAIPETTAKFLRERGQEALQLEEAAASVKTSVTAVPHTRTPDISARRSMRSSDPIHAQL